MTDELVTVGTYMFLPMAELDKLKIEDAGIPAFITDAETVAIDWLYGNAIGWIKLEVPQTQAEQATQIITRNKTSRTNGSGDEKMSDIDELERHIYELKLHLATLYRILTSKNIATQEEIRDLMKTVDAEDGTTDGEFYGDVVGP